MYQDATDAQLGGPGLADIIEDLFPDCDAPVRPTNAWTRCWGAELTGDGTLCAPNFVQGGGHMKNKFCAECRRRPLEVAAERVRTVSPAQRAQFANSTSPSLWTNGVRVVNQTSRCS